MQEAWIQMSAANQTVDIEAICIIFLSSGHFYMSELICLHGFWLLIRNTKIKMLATYNFLLPKEDDYEHIKQVLVIQLPFPTSFCSEKTGNFQSYRKKDNASD